LASELNTAVSAPCPLAATHDLTNFSCGKAPLDDWLREKARKAEGLTARTYVICLGTTVVGYYALAAGSVVRTSLPGKLRRNAPENVPVSILARLAVDNRSKGTGLGAHLLEEALSRSIQMSEIAGIRAILVHAIDDEAMRFYAKYGFIESPIGSQSLILPIETLRRSL
jgi:GNAT superfamily N-acetyltransferase